MQEEEFDAYFLSFFLLVLRLLIGDCGSAHHLFSHHIIHTGDRAGGGSKFIRRAAPLRAVRAKRGRVHHHGPRG